MRVLWIICLYLLCSNTLYTQEKKVTIKSAAQQAQENRDDLRSFEFAERASQNAERAALATYLPQIEIITTVGRGVPAIIPLHDDGTPITYGRTIYRRDVSLGFSQLLLNGGTPILDYKIAREGTRIVTAEEWVARNSVQFQTEKAFLQAQQVLLEKEFIETRDISSRVVFEQASAKRTVELFNEAQWMSAMAQYTAEQADVKNYKHNVQQRISVLRRETNSPIQAEEIDLSLKNIAAIHLEPLAHYLELAQKNRPDLTVQKHVIRQARYSETRYARNYVPSVSLYGLATNLQLGNCKTGRFEGWAAGVEFSWAFDGFGSASTSEQYRNQTRQYRLQKRDLELSINQQVEQAYLQIKNVMNQLKAAQYNYEQAKSNLDLTQWEYKVGNAAPADLTQAQVAYEKANFELMSLQIGVRGTYQNLLFVCGYPPTRKAPVGMPVFYRKKAQNKKGDNVG